MKFVKGKSGNPGGKPADKPFTDALRLAIHRAHGDRRRLDNVANALISRAEAGDVSAIVAIADRLEGKPLQQIETTVTRTDMSTLSDAEFTDLIAAVRSAEAGSGSKPRGTKTNGKAEPDSIH